MQDLLDRIGACTRCAEHLPHHPRPVVQLHNDAKILIAGQAPGAKVQATGVPFDDASGERLRSWMGLETTTFYDSRQVAILPMGFCYPGTGKSGDLPPREECAPLWREEALAQLAKVELTLVIGQYALGWHLPESHRQTVTETVRQWAQYWPSLLPLPHPSPRNNRWLKKNPWFEKDVVPVLRARVAELL